MMVEIGCCVTLNCLEQLNLQALLALPYTQCVGDVLCRVPDDPERDPHPERVEEDEIHPEVHEVARIEVQVTNEPLGAKGHEA